ncbi:MAG TPA: hypothetical protein VNT75_05370, partial [Symbiobacteriaceae bacterium]|nr:hypothetical protein [Symbiobacteriaceae bacterium]
MQTRSALMQVLRALESAMPAEEVAHSLHADALKVSVLKAAPAMELYTEASRDHLAAMAATAGYIRRILSGDTDRETWVGLQTAMMSLHPSHVAARDAFRELVQSEEAAARSEALGSLGQVLGVVEQAHSRVMSSVQPLTTIDVSAAGPGGLPG